MLVCFKPELKQPCGTIGLRYRIGYLDGLSPVLIPNAPFVVLVLGDSTAEIGVTSRFVRQTTIWRTK